MDAEEQVKRFQEFFDENYKADVLSNASSGKNFVVVDFARLAVFQPELAEELLKSPEEVIRAAELAVEQFDLPSAGFRVRFSALPASSRVMIRDIRSGHIGSFISVEGMVRQKSDVRPQATSCRFECPACGNVISVLQLDANFKEPASCGCGRKGRFRLLSKELVDAQGIILEENPEQIEGGAQPKRINVFLKEDLVSPLSERKTNPGSRVVVSGQIKEVPIILRSGGKSTRFDLLLEANCVDSVEESFYDIQVNKAEEERIKLLASDPKVYERFIGSIAPSIFGFDEIKEALVLQMFGGVSKTRSDGIKSRGDIHVLLVGDPGAGKSALLKRISMVAPKGRYVAGKGATAAGLTASVVKDEFLGGWGLEAGALVLANNGLVCIDEMDKIGEEDRSAMHEALEQQTVSISKANIQATLLARTTVLAAANPKFGRFDPYATVAEQIDMPPTLINRFDLIFPIKDLPDAARDLRMARHMLGLHQNPNIAETDIDTEFLRKFIAYAKKNFNPKLTDSALEEITEFYVSMRSQGGADERVKRTIPVSPRQLEALVRLSEASARVRLSDKVTRKDAKRAIALLTYCLMQVGRDMETGQIDIDRIATSIPASQRSRIFTVKDIIAELESKIGKTIPIEDVMRAAVEQGLKESDVEEVIEKLKRTGDIYEPKQGFLTRL